MGYIACPKCGNVFDAPGFHTCPSDRAPLFVRIREPGGVEQYIVLKAIKGATLIKQEGQARAFLDVTLSSGKLDRLDLEMAEAERAFAIITTHGGLDRGAL